MTDHQLADDTLVQARAVRHRLELEARRRAETTDATLARLAAESAALGRSLERTKAAIEAEWRAEHRGLEPERPPAWRR